MSNKKSNFLLLALSLPLLIGITIISYWYYLTRIEKKPSLPDLGTIPDFSFTADDKRSFSRHDLLETITIADFIFTQCAGACPIMSTKMSELQKEFMFEPRLQLVSFTVDPETDTPEVLSEYAGKYGAVKGKWRFLTGKKNDIDKLVQEGFHLGVSNEDENAIEHSQKFVLLDKQARIRGYYDSEDEMSMKKLVRDAKTLCKR